MLKINDFIKTNGIKIHTNEIAFSKLDIFKFIEILESNKKFILGGDIWYKKDKYFFITYKNWYSELGILSQKESIKVSINYIEKYVKNDEYIVIIYK